MTTISNANLFFTLSASGFAVLFVFAAIIAVYVIAILRDIRTLTNLMRTEAEKFSSATERISQSISAEGLVGGLAQLAYKQFRSKKNGEVGGTDARKTSPKK